MHAYHGHDERRVPPLILGHEAAGLVTEGELAGTRVAINPLMTCGKCRYCIEGRTNLCPQREIIGMRLPGAFAEQVAVNADNLIPLPEGMSELAASLMEPTAVSLHSVVLAERVLSRPLSEARVLVIGGGAIGLLAALVANHKSAAQIMLAETGTARRATIADTGCCEVFDPLGTAVPEAGSFDLVIDAVGSAATRRSACAYAAPGGVISHIGLQDNDDGLDVRRLTLQEITLIGNYTYSVTDLHVSLDLLARNALGDLAWVEARPLADGDAAFRDIHTGQCAAPKIVLHP